MKIDKTNKKGMAHFRLPKDVADEVAYMVECKNRKLNPGEKPLTVSSVSCSLFTNLIITMKQEWGFNYGNMPLE